MNPATSFTLGIINLAAGCALALGTQVALFDHNNPYLEHKGLKTSGALAGGVLVASAAVLFARAEAGFEAAERKEEEGQIVNVMPTPMQLSATSPIESMQQIMLMGMMAKLMPMFEGLGLTQSLQPAQDQEDYSTKALSGTSGTPGEDIPDWGKDLIIALASFKIKTQWVGYDRAPSFIRAKVKPGLGVRINEISKLADDLKVALTLPESPLIEAQPGYVSIDLPRKPTERQFVELGSYTLNLNRVTIPIGVDMNGNLVEADLSDPNTCHFLVGGTTGGGKSEYLTAVIVSLVIRFNSSEVRIAIIDPKRVTFPFVEKSVHLIAPIAKDPDDAINLAKRLVNEMERRYRLFEEARVVDIDRYNEKAEKPLPRIICVIDEYADLVGEEDNPYRRQFEPQCIRIGQKARAAGIHLIVATQKPSTKVLNSVLRSNLPARIAFKVATVEDSKVVLGSAGAAHNLLGKGDLLYESQGKRQRLQAPICWNPKALVLAKQEECQTNSVNPTPTSQADRSSQSQALPPSSRPTLDSLLTTILEFALSQAKPVDIRDLIAADLPGLGSFHEGGILYALEKLVEQGKGRIEVVEERVLFYPNKSEIKPGFPPKGGDPLDRVSEESRYLYEWLLSRGWKNASDVKRLCWRYKESNPKRISKTPEEIRAMFQELASVGLVELRGEGEGLEARVVGEEKGESSGEAL